MNPMPRCSRKLRNGLGKEVGSMKIRDWGKKMEQDEIRKLCDKDGFLSLLTVAMYLHSKSDVEDIVSGLLVLFNRSLNDMYDQYYPVGLKVPKDNLKVPKNVESSISVKRTNEKMH